MKTNQRRFLKIVQANSLFLEVLLLTVAGVVVACTLTMAISWNNSQKLHLDTISYSSKQSLGQVQEAFAEWTQEHSSLLYALQSGWAVQSFLTTQDATTLEARQASYQLTTLLKQLDFIGENGFSWPLILTDVKGAVKKSYAYSTVTEEFFLQKAASYKGQGTSSKPEYIFIQNGPSEWDVDHNCILMSKTLRSRGNREIYGFAYVVVRQGQLKSAYTALSNASSRLMLLNDEGIIVSAEDETLIGRSFPQLLKTARAAEQQDLAFAEAIFQEAKVHLVSVPISNWGLHAIAIIDNQTVVQHVRESFYETLFVCLLVILAMLLVLFTRLEFRFAPLRQLIRHMEHAKEKEMFMPIQIKGGYEVRQLGTAYNRMAQRAESYVGALQEKERQKRKMEIRSLRMQLDPHFIYNTLASIKFLIIHGENQNAEKALDMLTLLLRSNISSDQEFITLERELASVESYAFLQKIRFGDRISLQFHCEESAKDCLVPKLMLQPFVENAFFHAFPEENDSGLVSIFARVKKGELVCEIIDNGCGFSSQEAVTSHSAQERESIGIRNVNERLQLLYGENFGVSISSSVGGGTCVTIRLPAGDQ